MEIWYREDFKADWQQSAYSDDIPVGMIDPEEVFEWAITMGSGVATAASEGHTRDRGWAVVIGDSHDLGLMCPRCETRPPEGNDYLCWPCRSGQ